MTKIILAIVSMMTIAGCSTAGKEMPMAAEELAAAALAAAPVGSANDALVGPAGRAGWCTYRDAAGKLYEAKCRA